jgi:hypothetical protein
VKVIGYGAASKAAQQLSWDRVNAVINYLVEKQGVAESWYSIPKLLSLNCLRFP